MALAEDREGFFTLTTPSESVRSYRFSAKTNAAVSNQWVSAIRAEIERQEADVDDALREFGALLLAPDRSLFVNVLCNPEVVQVCWLVGLVGWLVGGHAFLLLMSVRWCGGRVLASNSQPTVTTTVCCAALVTAAPTIPPLFPSCFRVLPLKNNPFPSVNPVPSRPGSGIGDGQDCDGVD